MNSIDQESQGRSHFLSYITIPSHIGNKNDCKTINTDKLLHTESCSHKTAIQVFICVFGYTKKGRKGHRNKRILSMLNSSRQPLGLQKCFNPSAPQPMGTYDTHPFKLYKWPNGSELHEIDV